MKDHDTINVRIPTLIRATIARVARADDRSLGAMSRRLIQEALIARNELPLPRDDTAA